MKVSCIEAATKMHAAFCSQLTVNVSTAVCSGWIHTCGAFRYTARFEAQTYRAWEAGVMQYEGCC